MFAFRRTRFVLTVCLFVAPLCLASSGCYRHTYTVNGFVPEEEPAREPWQHHLLWGLVPLSSDLDLRDICPEGVGRIDNAMEPLNVLVTIITVGIYSPTTSTVYCRETDRGPVSSRSQPQEEENR